MSEQFSTFTEYQQAKQQEKMAKYQANIADSNRRATLSRGVEDENRRTSQAKDFIGEMRGGQSASGVAGQSAIDVLRDSMINMEHDTQTMRAGYLQEGQNIKQQANMFRYQAKQYGQKARQILVAGAIKTGEQVAMEAAGGGFAKTAGGGFAKTAGGGFAKTAGGQNIPVAPSGAGTGKSWTDPDTGRRY
jgi:hypothetical protein